MSAPFLLQAAIQAAANDPKRMNIRAYNGGRLQIRGYHWPVVIDIQGIRPRRENLPLFRDHDETRVVGHVEKLDMRSGTHVDVVAIASGAGQDTAEILAASKNGFPWESSIGAKPTSPPEEIRAGKKIRVNGRTIEGPFILARSCELYEISIVANGGDNEGAAVHIAAAAELSSQGTNPMAEPIQANQDPNPQPQPPAYDPLKATWDQGGQTESERLQARFEHTRREYGGILPDAMQPLLQSAMSGISFAEFDRECLRAENRALRLRATRGERPPAPAIHSSREPAARGDVLEAKILCQLGREKIAAKHFNDCTLEAARKLPGGTISDVCRLAIQADRQAVPSDRDTMLRAAFSTVSLPTALGNTLGKVAMEAYADTPATWRSFAAIKSVSNFHSHSGLRLSDANDVEEVGAAGELHHASLDESAYDFSVSTFGKILTLTRKTIVNDDVGLLADAATLLGKGARRRLNKLVYTVLLANAGSHFHADNANLETGGGSALDIDALAAAVLALRNMVDADSEPIDLIPKVLLVPPTLEPTARQLLHSVELLRITTDQLPTGNPMAHLNLALEVEPRLEASGYTGYSTTVWYLFTGPQDAPMIVAFLNGRQEPTVEQVEVGADVLGSGWRVYFDFGAALADPKAGIKNDGA